MTNTKQITKGETVMIIVTGKVKQAQMDVMIETNKMCEENCYKLFDPSFKPHTWEDVFRVANQ